MTSNRQRRTLGKDAASSRETFMTAKRNRRKNSVPLDERLQRLAGEAREAAGRLPNGQQRDALLRKARQAETAVNWNELLSSPGLQSPR
jgi:hypothetical protein